VMNILTTLASFLKLDRLVISLFILLSASAQYFIWSFGVVIDR
ncbi:phosphoethanolamine transferase domain-containing protein, partial [Klebsiella quasipneumoniae]